MVDSTVVGESILVSGNLEGDEDLTVLGRVHGSIQLTKTLVISESGIVKADVNVRNAIVSGVLVGNVTASDSVELLEAGRVVGDIKAPRIIIVDGARFRGNVDMGNLDAPRPTGPLPSRTVDRSSSQLASQSLTPTPTRAAPTAVPSRASTRTASTRSARPVTSSLKKAKPKSRAPVATKKKIKKKVVVKKRR